MSKWDTNTTPLATNKLHERNHSCSCSTATRHEIELWPKVNTILYIMTDAKSCHEQPRADRNYKELKELSGKATSGPEVQEMQIDTRKSKSCQ